MNCAFIHGKPLTDTFSKLDTMPSASDTNEHNIATKLRFLQVNI